MKKNMLLNAIKGIMSLIFPLITFPYISRVLGVENLGRVNFANSVVSYFILIGSFGISSYATREGASVRSDREKFNRFANEIFSINVLTAFFAYMLLLVVVICGKTLHGYVGLIAIYAATILFNVLSVEWVYTSHEEYTYITLRSIVFQIISIILMLLFVKNESKISAYAYAMISVFANAGSGILNFIRSRRYCHIHLVKNMRFKYHMKPMCVFFGTAFISTIFVSSDTTLLGFLCGDAPVGIYAVSVRIYTLVKTLLTSLIMVSIPQLSELYLNKKSEEFQSVSEDVLNVLVTFLIPAMIGIILMSKEIILIIAGEEYLASVKPLIMLSIALGFSIGSLFYGQCILIPCKKESINLYAAIICAVVNVLLNLILIPRWQENAAAFTTIIAEATGFFIFWISARKIVKYRSILKLMVKVALGCGGICVTCLIIKLLVNNYIICTVLSVSLSVFVYLGIEVLCRNQAVYEVIKKMKAKIGGREQSI